MDQILQLCFEPISNLSLLPSAFPVALWALHKTGHQKQHLPACKSSLKSSNNKTNKNKYKWEKRDYSKNKNLFRKV